MCVDHTLSPWLVIVGFETLQRGDGKEYASSKVFFDSLVRNYFLLKK